MNPQMYTLSSQLTRRRALLLAGVGLGSLALAACGNNSSEATVEQEANNSSVSASGDSQTPTRNPDATVTKGTTGEDAQKGEKGKYTLATEQGPAQNVPEPAYPDDSYNIATLEGLKKSIFAWIEWRNYGVQTGKYTVARQFVSSDFKSELENYDFCTELYKQGGWIVDGLDKYEFHGDTPYIRDDGIYVWEVYRLWLREVQVRSDGLKAYRRNKRHDDDTFDLHIRHDGKGWLLQDMVKKRKNPQSPGSSKDEKKDGE